MTEPPKPVIVLISLAGLIAIAGAAYVSVVATMSAAHPPAAQPAQPPS